MNKNSAGRPPRKTTERIRTQLWVRAVCVRAGRAPDDLQEILGRDGEWAGLWSRYARGLVAPQEERRQRIEALVPGAEHYYSSSLWALLEDRTYPWTEMRGYIDTLCKLLRDGFIEDARHAGAKGKFWRSGFDPGDLLQQAALLASDQRFGMDALVTILLVMKEAELLQDPVLYLEAQRNWAMAEQERRGHLILRELPVKFFEAVADPVRHVRFSNLEIDDIHNRFLIDYCKRNKTTRASCDILDFLRTSAIY